MRNNVIDYLNEIVDKKPDKVAFASDKDEMTFRQVYEQASQRSYSLLWDYYCRLLLRTY